MHMLLDTMHNAKHLKLSNLKSQNAILIIRNSLNASTQTPYTISFIGSVFCSGTGLLSPASSFITVLASPCCTSAACILSLSRCRLWSTHQCECPGHARLKQLFEQYRVRLDVSIIICRGKVLALGTTNEFQPRFICFPLTTL
jgi:hypothetical protein